jgi:hypothetical protein
MMVKKFLVKIHSFVHFLSFAQNFKKMHQQIKKSNNFIIK